MPPICIEDLHCSSDCPAPLIRRKSGRLKKKRREKKKKHLCMKRYSMTLIDAVTFACAGGGLLIG